MKNDIALLTERLVQLEGSKKLLAEQLKINASLTAEVERLAELFREVLKNPYQGKIVSELSMRAIYPK